MENRFDAELEAQRKVARLHEEQAKQAEGKVQRLLQEVESLRTTYEDQARRAEERAAAQRERFARQLADVEKVQWGLICRFGGVCLRHSVTGPSSNHHTKPQTARHTQLHTGPRRPPRGAGGGAQGGG